MKTHAGHYEMSHSFRPPAKRPLRRKTVDQILRAAYRRHMRDRQTLLALKRELR